LKALHLRAAETDTASPEGSRVRAAITTLEMIRDQRGCEEIGIRGLFPHMSHGRSGKLVDLIDVIVFG